LLPFSSHHLSKRIGKQASFLWEKGWKNPAKEGFKKSGKRRVGKAAKRRVSKSR
jgi:hypothetical protein